MTPDEANALLFKAAQTGNVADTQAALDAGADANARDHLKRTPLHWAESIEIARLLLGRGADVSATDKFRQTPLIYACQERPRTHDLITLLKAAAKQQRHADRVTGERKDKGPPQVGG